MPPKSSRAPKRSHRPHDTDSDVDDEAQAHPSDEVGHRQKLHLLAGQLFVGGTQKPNDYAAECEETRQALQTAIPSLTMGLAAAHQRYGQLNMCFGGDPRVANHNFYAHYLWENDNHRDSANFRDLSLPREKLALLAKVAADLDYIFSGDEGQEDKVKARKSRAPGFSNKRGRSSASTTRSRQLFEKPYAPRPATTPSALSKDLVAERLFYDPTKMGRINTERSWGSAADFLNQPEVELGQSDPGPVPGPSTHFHLDNASVFRDTPVHYGSAFDSANYSRGAAPISFPPAHLPLETHLATHPSVWMNREHCGAAGTLEYHESSGESGQAPRTGTLDYHEPHGEFQQALNLGPHVRNIFDYPNT